MLTLRSMTDAEYNLWWSGIPYDKRLFDGLDYEEFSITRLMLSYTVHVYVRRSLLLLLLVLFLYLVCHGF